MRNASTHPVRILIAPRRITYALALVAAAFVLLSIAANFVAYWASGNESLLARVAKNLAPLFDVDAEANIPTWFQTILLLMSATVVAANAVVKKKTGDSYVLHWMALSLVFLYLSVDEMASLHEMASWPVRDLLHTSGALYYAWIIPGGILTMGFGATYLKFLVSLPLKTKILFCIAGSVFVLGAIGIEALGGMWVVTYGAENLKYKLITTLEESAEMLGVIIFIHANLDYLRSNVQEISFQLGTKAEV